MNSQPLLRIVFAAVIAVALGACAMYPKSGQPALAGTWTNSYGTVWMLNADGTFTVDLNKDGKPDVWGKYSVSGDEMTISEVKGKTPKSCRKPATYKFARTGEKTLSFTLVKDSCKLRKQHILAGWTAK